MIRPFAVLTMLAPGAALAHDGGAGHLHPHGLLEGWALGFALLGAAGALVWGVIRERRK
jgi:hypothetical protein